MYDERQQQTEFNENANQIQRLHNKYLEISNALENGNFETARWKLNSVEVELNEHAESLDESNGRENEKKFVDQLEKINKSLDNSPTKGHTYSLLLEKHKLLRKIQQKIGMGTTFKDLDEDELE